MIARIGGYGSPGSRGRLVEIGAAISPLDLRLQRILDRAVERRCFRRRLGALVGDIFVASSIGFAISVTENNAFRGRNCDWRCAGPCVGRSEIGYGSNAMESP